MNDVADINELFQRVRNAEDVGLRNTMGLSSHEEKCTLRYEALWAEVRSGNRNQRWATTALLGGMAAILAKQIFFT